MDQENQEYQEYQEYQDKREYQEETKEMKEMKETEEQEETKKNNEELFKYIDTEPHRKREHEERYIFNNNLDKDIFFKLPLTYEQRKELYDHFNIFI